MPPCNCTQLSPLELKQSIINLLSVVLYIVLPLNCISPVLATPPPETWVPLTNSVPVSSIVNVELLIVRVSPSAVMLPKYTLDGASTVGLASTHWSLYLT